MDINYYCSDRTRSTEHRTQKPCCCIGNDIKLQTSKQFMGYCQCEQESTLIFFRLLHVGCFFFLQLPVFSRNRFCGRKTVFFCFIFVFKTVMDSTGRQPRERIMIMNDTGYEIEALRLLLQFRFKTLKFQFVLSF
jgi:hypothetical protein